VTSEGERYPGAEPEGPLTPQRPPGGSPPEESLVDRAVDLFTAVGLGIRDTARDVLDAGRKGAREAHDEYWGRYDAKTKLRRQQVPPARIEGRRKNRKKR
jgi:hypothetical protein